MKSSKQIQAYILKNGNKRTNAEMATKLEVPRMTFAGVLAAMKRRGDISNTFLKSDTETSTRKTTTKTSSAKKVNSVSKVSSSKVSSSKVSSSKVSSSKTSRRK